MVRAYSRQRPVLEFRPGTDPYVPATKDVYIDGQLVGEYRVGEMLMDPETAYIYWVGIEYEYRKRGYGRLVVEQILADLRAQGYKHVRIISMPESVGFWERMGFEKRYSIQEGPLNTQAGIPVEQRAVSMGLDL